LLDDTKITFRYTITRDQFSERKETCVVNLSRGENFSVRVDTGGPEDLLDALISLDNFFSIYVPGLSGIPHREQFMSDAVVNAAIFRGDANLYLRNLLLRIAREPAKKRQFSDLISAVFPGLDISITFDERRHFYISAHVTYSGIEIPLDMAGTGVLQCVQLVAYVVNYQPSLLLLDEPDAHLHADNQRQMAVMLAAISKKSTQVIMSTHSRYMLDALSAVPGANFVWLKKGKVMAPQSATRLAILMDLRALEVGEELFNGRYRVIVWTEDSITDYMWVILQANGFDRNSTLVRSYAGCSRADAAMIMARFISDIAPGLIILVHRDRDFMTDDEICRLRTRFQPALDLGIELFVTDSTDVEHYFTSPSHISHCTGLSLQDAQDLVDRVLADNQADFAMKFQTKREEIKNSLYRDDKASCPSAKALKGRGAIRREHTLGKDLLSAISQALQEGYGKNQRVLLQPSDHLLSPALRKISARISVPGGTP
jgi:hypothetical protein